MGIPGIIDLFFCQFHSGNSQELLHLVVGAQPGGFALFQGHMPHSEARVGHDAIRIRQFLPAVFQLALSLLLLQLLQAYRGRVCFQNDTVF